MNYTKPGLTQGLNEVWPWDITKLKGPVKWIHYYRFVILEIYSRYVVGWMVTIESLPLLPANSLERPVRSR